MSEIKIGIDEAIEILEAALHRESAADAVSFQLFISDYETTVEWQHRAAETLKRDGVSMRNIRGEWIE